MLIILSLICFWHTDVYAVPAAPYLHDLQQPDGRSFKGRQWGDEHYHGWETDTEHSIVFDEQLKGWAYAVQDYLGKLKSSKLLVDPTVAPPDHIPKRLRPLKSLQPIQSSSGMTVSEPAASELTLSSATTGSRNVPVILVNFSDTTFNYSSADFELLLFGTTNKSMRKYYLENSYNQLTLTSGPSGVVGPFTASNTHDYYGTDVSGAGSDQNPRGLVQEAVQLAIAAGFKFAPYVDQTRTCYVDAVNIVHQGRGQEAGGSTTDIWSHSWTLSSPYDTGEPCAMGGTIKVYKYVIQPEKLGAGMTTFGVFAHEYGHALGLPDLYDTNYTSKGDGKWTIMAGGSWLGGGGGGYGGDSPAHFDAWSKYFLGWITPISITGVNENMSITATSSVTASFYQIGVGTPNSGEYFLVENRNKSGFDSYLPGAGLLVWHIDGKAVSTYLSANTINNHVCTSSTPGACSGPASHYGISLIQADNLLQLEKNTNQGDSGDPFVSSKSWTDSSAPSSKFWDGTASLYGVTAISSSAVTMTAMLTGPSSSPGVVTYSATSITGTGATLSGSVNNNNAATTATFDYGLTTNYGNSAPGGSVSAGDANKAMSASISSLTCNTTYHFRAKATNSVGTSYGSDRTFTTTACVPGAPTITSATAGNSRAVVYFSSPASDGGSTILNYTVTPSSGLPVSNDTVPIVITGLANGTAYTFTAKATNAAGTGPASLPSLLAVTPGIAVIDDAYETGYQLLQLAYKADVAEKKIMLLADTLVGGLMVDLSSVRGNVTIRGGYNDMFTNDNGLPSILGKVTLSAGTTRFQNVVVRP
jgi:immune inhibitor A